MNKDQGWIACAANDKIDMVRPIRHPTAPADSVLFWGVGLSPALQQASRYCCSGERSGNQAGALQGGRDLPVGLLTVPVVSGSRTAFRTPGFKVRGNGSKTGSSSPVMRSARFSSLPRA